MWIFSGVARRIQLIAHARVPLLMFVDSELKISCDISVDNGSALFKSRVLRWITDMDPRCRKLIFMVSFAWITCCNISCMFDRHKFRFDKFFFVVLLSRVVCAYTHIGHQKLAIPNRLSFSFRRSWSFVIM